jgi:hypothetical protein
MSVLGPLEEYSDDPWSWSHNNTFVNGQKTFQKQAFHFHSLNWNMLLCTYQALGLVNNRDGEYNRDVAITHDHEPILEKGEYTQREVLSQVSQPER